MPSNISLSVRATPTRAAAAKRPFSIGTGREREIMKVISHIFGGALPDDDDGRAALFEVLNQQVLSGVSPDELRENGLNLLPEAGDDDTLFDMVQRIGKGRKRSADQVARALGVTLEMRTRLGLRTIGACDISKAERMEIAAQKEAADKRWKREQAGARPQAQSAARLKPWLALGVSKSTYYRDLKAQKTAAEAAEMSRETTLAVILLTLTDKPVSGDPVEHSAGAIVVSPQPRLERDAPADPSRPHRQTPAVDRQKPEGVVSEMQAGCDAEPMPRSAAERRERERLHLEERARLHLSEVVSGMIRSDDPASWQRQFIAATSAWRGHSLLDDDHHHHAR